MNAETRSNADSNDLLSETINAHDPSGRWGNYSQFTARMTVAGALWGLKRVGGLFDDITLAGDLAEQRDVISPFTGPDRRGSYTPGRTAIETLDGSVVEERLNPLDAFRGQTRLTPWTPLQALYFASYANWNYFVAPYVYRWPGFSTRSAGVWNEDGNEWRRLEITYPEGFATHSQVQTIYLADDGLIARLDYSVDILGNAPAAHYPSNYKQFNGILVPTKREVFVRNPDGSPDRSAVTIDIDVHDIVFA